MASFRAEDLLTIPNKTVHLHNQPSARDLDVRQDAVERLVKTAKREGVTLPEHREDLVSYLNERPQYINTALRSAKSDAYRKTKVRANTVSLSQYYKQAEAVVDERQENEMIAAESATAKDELEAFMGSATAPEREAVELLAYCQKLIYNGETIPSAISNKLSRLRRQTGLPLDVSLL